MPKTELVLDRESGAPRAAAKTFGEFFAGIGLVRLGLKDSGWSCVYANDIDPQKQALYEGCFGQQGGDHFHLGDVGDTDEVLARLEAPPFLATASFPCTDLSTAGHWKGLEGQHSSTFYDFMEVVGRLGERQPRMIMLENVPGLITSKSGKDFAAVVDELASKGYWIDALISDARHFVPQSRPRVFIVGVHDSLMPRVSKILAPRQLFDFAAPEPSEFRPRSLLRLMQAHTLQTGWIEFPLQRPPRRRQQLADVIDTDPDQEWWDDEKVQKHCDMMSDLHRQQVQRLRRGGGLQIGTIYRRKRGGQTRAEIRFDGVAGCLRTPRGGSARQIVIVLDGDETRMRWMSPREYARLQGAGRYPLAGRASQQLFGFGDAVCVPVIRWIDRNILTPVFDATTESSRFRRARD